LKLFLLLSTAGCTTVSSLVTIVDAYPSYKAKMMTVDAGALEVVVIYIKILRYFSSKALRATPPHLKAPGSTSE
jgi:hypothetical protein